MSVDRSELAPCSRQYSASMLVDEERSLTNSESQEDPSVKEQYRKIGQSLQGSDMDFDELVDLLGLLEDYTAYEKTTANICDTLIAKNPTLCGVKSQTPKGLGQRIEKDLTKWFNTIYDHMVDSDFSRCPDAKPREHFLLENHETNSVAGTLAKPDYVLYYEGYERSDFGSAHVIIEAKLAQFDCNLPVEVLGQIGYYAKCVWEKQFTRTFVPVILLHGTKVDLCLFSRSGYSRVPLGRFIKDPKKHIEGFERTIATTIRKLWFFLIQPSERFGHFVNVSSKPRYLLFNREKRYATVKRAALDCDSSVRVTGRIDRKVEVSHRVAYLLNVRYQGEEAVLKLSWLPVKRQPEGVLYDLLNGGNHRVDCIPKVFRSGILVSDFLGYRLEFILMEHCGKPLIDEFKEREA